MTDRPEAASEEPTSLQSFLRDAGDDCYDGSSSNSGATSGSPEQLSTPRSFLSQPPHRPSHLSLHRRLARVSAHSASTDETGALSHASTQYYSILDEPVTERPRHQLSASDTASGSVRPSPHSDEFFDCVDIQEEHMQRRQQQVQQGRDVEQLISVSSSTSASASPKSEQRQAVCPHSTVDRTAPPALGPLVSRQRSRLSMTKVISSESNTDGGTSSDRNGIDSGSKPWWKAIKEWKARSFGSNYRNLFTNWRHFLLILVLGQILSLCITSTTVLTTELANQRNVSIPTTQSFLVYVLLAIIYVPITLVLRRPRDLWHNFRRRWYWYIILAAVDVEGNYFVVKAYDYTSLLSCMLLDAWTIPVVVVLMFFLMKIRFHWSQYLGVVVCLVGLGLLIKSDMDSGKNYKAKDAVKGDIFMLIGATCYGVSNTLEEYIVRQRPQYETVAWMGVFGTVINGIQLVVLERKELARLHWDGKVVGFTLGFDFTMVVLYSLAPILFRLSSSAFYNLSILTSDFYGLVFGIYLFGYKILPLYAGAYAIVIVGIIIYNVSPYKQPEELAKLPGWRPKQQQHQQQAQQNTSSEDNRPILRQHSIEDGDCS